MRRRNLLVAGTAGLLTAGAGPAVAAPAPLAASGAVPGKIAVHTGMDRLAASNWDAVRGELVGVVSNLTAVDREYRHLVDRMHAAGVTIGGIFGPEHGFRGSARVGGNEGIGADPRTGLTVYDGYLATVDRWAAMFTEAGVKTVVFDIQDIGTRFYTYIWTMYESMSAAASLGLRYLVLDRPNPIGGRAFGPMLQPAHASGIGRKEIVQQHGMTVGELARYFNGELLKTDIHGPVRLEVVECEGWHGGLFAADTDVPWVMPSPNMPTPETAHVYPGTGMVEGVASLSEGRGTTHPFELIGGPGYDYHWGDRTAEQNLPGVEIREAYFVPTVNKFAEQFCSGVELKVVDRAAFDPIRTAVALLVEARKYPSFAWRDDGGDRPFFIDKLSGSTRLRTMIDAGATTTEVVDAWQPELATFDTRRTPYLIYPRSQG